MATMDYKCSSCGAPLSFNPEKQNFVCEYCGSAFTTQQIQSLYAEKEQKETVNEREVKASEQQRAQAQRKGEDFDEDFMVSLFRASSSPTASSPLLLPRTRRSTRS